MPIPVSPNAAYTETGPTAPAPAWAQPARSPLAPVSALPAGSAALDSVMETPLGAAFSQAPGLVGLMDPGGVILNPPPGFTGIGIADRVQNQAVWISLGAAATAPAVTPSEPTMNGYPCLVMNPAGGSFALRGWSMRKASGATGHFIASGNPSFTWIGAANRASVTPPNNDYFFGINGNPLFYGYAGINRLVFLTNVWNPTAGQLSKAAVIGLSYDAATNTSEIWVNGVMVSSAVHPGFAFASDIDVICWQYSTTAMVVGKCGGAGLFNLALAQRVGGNLVYGNAMQNVMLALKAMYAF